MTVHLGADTHVHQSIRSGCAAVHGGVPYEELTNLRVAQRRVMMSFRHDNTCAAVMAGLWFDAMKTWSWSMG